MEITFIWLFYFMLLKFKVFSTERGVCSQQTESGNYEKVCCADFEEINSECKPCPIGYISKMGQICRPCPPKVFGIVCSEDCYCNEFERCDNILGCVEKGMTETSTEEESTKSKTITTVANPSVLSSREVVVFYILSAAVLLLLILLICLCLVIIKHKRDKRGLSINTSNNGPETTNQTVEDNNELRVEDYHVYNEIDDTEIDDIQVEKPKGNHNDYLEVAVESKSSTNNNSGNPERNSYLNPYQPPCNSTEDTRSSYEKLQMKMIETSNDNKKKGSDLQDQDDSISLTLSTLSSYHDIEVKRNSDHNDFIEVVSKSSNNSDCGKQERNSYHSQCQPCFATEDIESTNERLQMQTISTPCDNEKTGSNLLDQDSCISPTLPCVPSSYDHQTDEVGAIQSGTHIPHQVTQIVSFK